jgi:hypothetical protein
LNQDADTKATGLYVNYSELEENARLLDVPLTPELRERTRRNANRSLAEILKYDCSRSPFEKQVRFIYKPIPENGEIPTIKDAMPIPVENSELTTSIER